MQDRSREPKAIGPFGLERMADSPIKLEMKIFKDGVYIMQVVEHPYRALSFHSGDLKRIAFSESTFQKYLTLEGETYLLGHSAFEQWLSTYHAKHHDSPKLFDSTGEFLSGRKSRKRLL